MHLQYFKKCNNLSLSGIPFEESKELLEFIKNNSLIVNYFDFDGEDQSQLEYFTNPEFYNGKWTIDYTFNNMHEISKVNAYFLIKFSYKYINI